MGKRLIVPPSTPNFWAYEHFGELQRAYCNIISPPFAKILPQEARKDKKGGSEVGYIKREPPNRNALLQCISASARVYTMKEVCLLLDTCEYTVRQLIKTGKLRGYRIPDTPYGRWKISEKALEDYRAACEEKEAPTCPNPIKKSVR